VSVELDRPVSPSGSVAAEYQRYKALSAMAVAAMVVAILSAGAFLTWLLAIVPVCGILLGLLAWRRVRRNADELTGVRLSQAAIALSAIFLVAGLGRLTYIYVNEVPEGYERISYSQLQPDEANASQTGEMIPESAQALDGKRVFIKGYMYPGEQQTKIRSFVLCRDNGDCCFGGNPKLTDRILVELDGQLATDYVTRQRHLAGTFRVRPSEAVDGLGVAVYRLEADYLK
jgi:hypothetical protein